MVLLWLLVNELVLIANEVAKLVAILLTLLYVLIEPVAFERK